MRSILRKLLFLIITFVLILGWLYFGEVLLNGSVNVEKAFIALQPQENVLEKVDFSQPTPEPLNPVKTPTAQIKQTAWIPDWDMENGYASLVKAATHLYSVSPVWYYLEADTKIRTNRTKLDDVTKLTKQYGIKLIPTISGFDADDLHQVLATPEKTAAHLAYLEKEITDHNYDGFDLDYEATYIDDKAAFFDMISQLSTFLHDHGKIFSVTVIQQSVEPRAARQTPTVQDWTEIAAYADEIRIMAYDYTGYVSQYPGPIAPYDWQESILRYARGKVDMSKVYLGINLYGYDGWSNNSEVRSPYPSYETNPRLEKAQVDAVTYKQIQANKKYQISDVLNPDFLERVMRYQFKDKQYVIIYPDASTVTPRKQLAAKYGAAGVAYWRMGNEDPNVYL